MDSSLTIRLPRLVMPERNAAADACPIVPQIQQTEISDEALMVSICDGSKEALAVLFRRYARLVRTVANRILRDDSEADDLLQEVFLFVHRNCSIFDSSKAGVRSWLVQMTYHRAIDRKRYLSSRHFYTRLSLEGIADLPDRRAENQQDDSWLGALVGTTTIEKLLDTLTEDQRNTLSLHFCEGYTFAEIAVKLDQSSGNIRHHYYRALDHLRKRMFPGRLPGGNGCGRK